MSRDAVKQSYGNQKQIKSLRRDLPVVKLMPA